MGDLQFWIYVIAIVIYALSRALKKPAQNPEAPQQPERRQRTPAAGEPMRSAPPANPVPRQMTFEELLREISEAKSPKRQEPKPLEDAYTSYETNYEEELKEEAEDLEDESFDYSKKDSVYEVYEEAKRQAFARPSLEETMSNADTDVRFGRFKEFEQKEEKDLMKAYLSDLKDPEGLKKAFVLSEVFQRKF